MHRQCLFRCLAPNRSLPLLFLRSLLLLFGGSPGDSAVKNPPADSGDAGGVGSVPGLEPGRHGHPLQHSCWESYTDRGAWRAAVHGVTESDRTECLTAQLERYYNSDECHCLVRPTRWGLGTTAPSSHSLDEWQTQRNSLSCLALRFSI